MTETQSSTTETKTVRISGQEAIDYANGGNDTRLNREASPDAPPMDDVSVEDAEEMVDGGVDADLFYCEADPRIVALGRFLGDVFDSEESKYEDNRYEQGRDSYRVLTDAEADEAAAEAIKSSLWAFNADFISAHTKKGLSTEARKALTEAQGKLCEGANDLVEAMIDDLDHFIEDAIRCDGRGHFLAGYDGEENEETVGGVTYYIYRD